MNHTCFSSMPFKASKLPYTISPFHIPGSWRLEDSKRRIAEFYVCLGLKAVKWPEREVDQGKDEDGAAPGRGIC